MKKFLNALLVGTLLVLASNVYSSTSKISAIKKNATAMAPLIMNISGGTVNAGEQICLDLSVQDFDDIEGFQFTLTYNQNVFRFDEVPQASLNLSGLEQASFNLVAPGQLVVSWFTSVPVTVDDDEVIAQLCFTGLNSGLANLEFYDDPGYPNEAYNAGSMGTNIGLTGNTNAISIIGGAACGTGTGLSFFASHTSALPGDEASVFISAQDFIDIISFSWSLYYDISVVQFDTVIGLNLPGFDPSFIRHPHGKLDSLTVSWLQGGAFDGVTLTDCEPFLEFRFTVVGNLGEASPFQFAETPLEVEIVDKDGTTVRSTLDGFYDGSITVGQPSGQTVRFSASNETVEEGKPVCVDVSANGFTDVLHAQFSMAWEDNNLDFVQVKDYNLPGLGNSNLTINANNGTLEVDWDAPNNTPVTVSSNTTIFKVCFDAIGAAGTMTDVTFEDTPTSQLVTNVDMDTLTFNGQNGTVTIEQPPGQCGSLDGLSFYAGNVSGATGDTVCVPITAADFIDILTLQFSMTYDVSVLEYIDVNAGALSTFSTQNQNIGNPDPGDLTISWTDNTFNGITLPDCTVLFEICFRIIGDDGEVGDLNFTDMPLEVEIADKDGIVLLDEIGNSFEDGSVTVNSIPPAPTVTFIAADRTVIEGEQTCVNVSVEGFDDVQSAEFSMAWDATKLDFDQVANLNLPDLTMSDFTIDGANGRLALEWASSGTGVTVSAGTNIFQLCFTAEMGAGGTTSDISFTNTPTDQLIKNTAGDTLQFSGQRGVVTIERPPGACGALDGLSFYVDNVMGMPGDTVCVPIRAADFIDILTLQFSMTYDANLLEYVSVNAGSLTTFSEANQNLGHPATGELTISWTDNTFNGLTLNDCETLFELCFKVKDTALDGDVGVIGFSDVPLDVEIANSNGVVILDEIGNSFQDGAIRVTTGPPVPVVNFIAQDRTVEEGQRVCSDVTAEGFDDIFEMLYSMSYDTNLLENVQVQGFNLTDLSASNFTIDAMNGTIATNWAPVGITGVSVPSGTKLYEVCADAKPGTGGSVTDLTFTDTPNAQLIKNTAGDTLQFSSQDARITITVPPGQCGSLDGLSFYADHVTGQPGDTICVPVRAADFIDILTVQFSMFYDETLLQYESVNAGALAGFSEANQNLGIPAPGELTISWTDNTFNGVTYDDCTMLFELCFIVLGSDGDVAPVGFSDSPLDVEIANSNGNVILDELGNSFLDGAVTIEDNQPVFCDATVDTVVCYGASTGAIDLTATGGNGSFSYDWGQGVTTEDRQNIPAGNYSVTVTSGAMQCSLTVLVPQPMMELDITTEFIHVECFGDNNGAISLTPEGGWAPYTIEWDGGYPDGSPLENLSGGSYSGTVTDDLGCELNFGPLVVLGPTAALSMGTPQVNDITCNGDADGSILIPNISGGTPAYTITWTPAVNDDMNPTGLTEGTYYLSVKDANDCEIRDTFEITEPALLQIIPENIQNAPNGEVHVRVQGGSTPYNYRWTDSDGTLVGTDEDLIDVDAGVYKLTVTDDHGCMAMELFRVEGGPLMLDNVITEATCPGLTQGSIELVVVGGTAPYLATWAPPGPTHSALTATNLAAGNYAYTITDANNAQLTGSATVDSYNVIDIVPTIQPDPDEDCSGSISVAVAGGSGPSNLTTKIYDANNDLVALGTSYLNACFGSYTIEVTDDITGCTKTVTVVVPGGAPVSIVVLDITHAKCPNVCEGGFSLDFPTGVPQFDITVLNVVDGSSTFHRVNTNSFTKEDLCGGVYQVTVMDSRGTQAIEIIQINEPDPFTDTGNITPATNGEPNGRINLTVSGGTFPYQYLWSNGATTQDIRDLEPDCYDCTITDDNGCSFQTQEYCVPDFRLNLIGKTNVMCANDMNGEIKVAVTGTNLPFTYQWFTAAGDLIAGQADSILNNVPAGEYYVQVSNSLGTFLTSQVFTITAQSHINVEAIPTTNYNGFNVSCFESENGGARATGTNGVTPYSFAWNSGQNTQLATGLSSGIYTVTITDALQCTDTANVMITQPDPISSNVDIRDIECNGGMDGEIRVYPSGGVPSYTYYWLNIAGIPTDEPYVRFLGDSTYYLTIVDGNGCENDFEFTIEEPEEMNISATVTSSNNTCNGSIFLTVTGGNAPYEFMWSVTGPDRFDNPLEDLCPGDYTCVVTDANGCQQSITKRVDDIDVDCLATSAVITPEGDGLNEEFVINCLEKYPDNKLEIYNRWGQLVYEQENYDNLWNGVTQRGTDLPEGAYFFVFAYTSVNGQSQQRKGSFTLLRE